VTRDPSDRYAGQVVQLPPVEDALAVRLGPGQHARGGAGGHQDDVGPDVPVADRDDVRLDQPPLAAHDLDLLVGEPFGDVERLRPGQVLDPLVDGGHVGLQGADHPVRAAVVAQPQVGRLRHDRHADRGGDQRLGRHAVGQHARPAGTVALHHGHVGAELRRDESGLVAAGASTEDHDAGHGPIVSHNGQ